MSYTIYFYYTGTITVTNFVIDSNWFVLDFNPPTNDTLDGPFEGISFNCTTSNYEPVQSFAVYGDTSVNVSGVTPFTDYSCCAIPHWINKGNGREVCVNVSTMEAGKNLPVHTFFLSFSCILFQFLINGRNHFQVHQLLQGRSF